MVSLTSRPTWLIKSARSPTSLPASSPRRTKPTTAPTAPNAAEVVEGAAASNEAKVKARTKVGRRRRSLGVTFLLPPSLTSTLAAKNANAEPLTPSS